MRVWPLLGAGLLATAALDLVLTLATRDGVGPLEYAIGSALAALLALTAVRLGRRALQHA